MLQQQSRVAFKHISLRDKAGGNPAQPKGSTQIRGLVMATDQDAQFRWRQGGALPQ